MRASEAKQQTDLYFDLMHRATEARKRGDEVTALNCYKQSIPLLEGLMYDTKKELGNVGIDVPAIETGATLMAAVGDREGLDELRVEILRVKGLQAWLEGVNSAIEDLALSNQIITLVSEKPGILQKNLYKEIPAAQQRLGNLCYWLERVGRIRREKSGSSNAIYVSTGSQTFPTARTEPSPPAAAPPTPVPARPTGATRPVAKRSASGVGCGSLLAAGSLLALLSWIISVF